MNSRDGFGVGKPLLTTATIAVLSLGSLSFSQPAFGQTTTETSDAQGIDEITVTASRVVRDGYSAPTPVTVFGEDDILKAGEMDVFEAVKELPSLAGNTSTQTFGTVQSTGAGGLSTLNLRGLGSDRTLTLLDGQRVPAAIVTGATDAGAFPQALVQRVEIVTGGASASWGSDAVAGVVNYVLDHDFTGVKGTSSVGVTTYGDDLQGALSLTAGTGFADDRGHFTISGEYHDSGGVPHGIGSRDWYDGTRILQRTIADTPAGEPQYIVAPNVVDMRLAPGGIITSGPLMGITFGPGGAPYDFQYGSLIASPNMSGGDQIGDVAENSNLDSKLRRETLYARLSYDVTDSINAYVTFNRGRVKTSAHSYPGQFRTGTLRIQCDNAFLPSEIVAACADNDITSFQYGSYIADLPDSMSVNERTLTRYSVGADGNLTAANTDWDWGAYYVWGRTHQNNQILNGGINSHLSFAIDAVAGPNGQIVCRSELARANGCVPFNIIGTGVASQSAIEWVTGIPWFDTYLTQQVTAFHVSGDPFENWAGPVSVAFGGEYRNESFHQNADALSTGDGGDPLLNPAGRNWFTGNFRPSQGSFDVWEGYLETVVPLFASDNMGKAELSLAARATDYSTAGYVTTWKAGGTWSTPVSGISFRSTVSRDIRAPNLSELFRAPGSFTGTVIDRFPPFEGQSFTANLSQLANQELRPEEAKTEEFGIILRPDWLPGFNASVDYYHIRVSDAIGSVGTQTQIDLCFQGNQTLCDFIIRNSDGEITEVQLKQINLASTVTSGIDIEASYQADLDQFFSGAGGNILLRSLVTHVLEYDNISGIPNDPIDHEAGENSGSIADWRWYGTETYSTDRFSLTLTQRYVSDGVINNDWIECSTNCPVPTIVHPTVNNNKIEGALYWDVGGRFDLTPDAGDDDVQVELYLKIDNVTNEDPATAASAGSNPYLVRSVNPALYDTLGRTYRLGVRFSL